MKFITCGIFILLGCIPLFSAEPHSPENLLTISDLIIIAVVKDIKRTDKSFIIKVGEEKLELFEYTARLVVDHRIKGNAYQVKFKYLNLKKETTRLETKSGVTRFLKLENNKSYLFYLKKGTEKGSFVSVLNDVNIGGNRYDYMAIKAIQSHQIKNVARLFTISRANGWQKSESGLSWFYSDSEKSIQASDKNADGKIDYLAIRMPPVSYNYQHNISLVFFVTIRQREMQ